MTGSEKIEAAFSQAGSSETAAVICFEAIYYRDHWDDLTSCPWWYGQSYDIEHQLAWRRDCIAETPQDWFRLPLFVPREDREATFIEERDDGVYRVDSRNGEETRMRRPVVDGWSGRPGAATVPPANPASTPEEVDREVPLEKEFCRREFIESGRGDLATAMLEEFEHLCPIIHLNSPYWCTFSLWGYEEMMMKSIVDPELVEYAAGRFMANRIQRVREAAVHGARIVWFDECLTDQLSPQLFSRLSVPFLRALVGEVRRCGMKSVYYYCGDPNDRWDELFAVGADALALEDGKKGWDVDIEEVAARVDGRFTIMGNLGARRPLESGPESAIRKEVARQIDAGRANGGRFVMSVGSPVTAGTPVEHVRRYCEITHELSSQ